MVGGCEQSGSINIHTKISLNDIRTLFNILMVKTYLDQISA